MSPRVKDIPASARVPRPSPPNCPASNKMGAVQTQQAARPERLPLGDKTTATKHKDNDSYLASFSSSCVEQFTQWHSVCELPNRPAIIINKCKGLWNPVLCHVFSCFFQGRLTSHTHTEQSILNLFNHNSMDLSLWTTHQIQI